MKKVYVLLLIILCSINLIYGQTFTDIGAGLPGVSGGSSGWCDFDNDGDLDLVLSGSANQSLVTKIFRNDSGVFAEVNAGLLGLAQGFLDLGDYNNDSYVDILICGYTGTESVTKLYRNEGNCVFSEVSTTLPNITGSVSWGDYDNDSDLDVLINGTSYLGGDLISTIYRNDEGTFQNINADLTYLFDKSISWVDYDNDSDLDVVISGSSFGVYSSFICRNDKGIFTEVNTNILGVEEGSQDWGDFDNDGDLDLLITGYNDQTPIYRNSKVYLNDNGIFVEADSTVFSMLTGVSLGSAKWGDYDNDGDLDILLTGLFYSEGNTGNLLREGSVYTNDSGIFSSDPSLLLTRIQNSSTAWGDYDNDGDLDIFMSGWTGSTYISKIYRNNGKTFNTKPSLPSNLSTSFNGSAITFSWDKASDSETPQDGLSYNFYLGTESLQGDLNTSMSDNSTGYRKVVDLGNAQQNTSYTLYKDLPTGVYYWSVQAIDHAFAGSEFASEMSFIFSNPSSPVAVTASDITKTGFKANWEKVENADGYFIDVAKDESFTNYVPGYSNLDVGDTLSCVVENLTLFTDYFYRVRAYKINSSSSINSNVILVKTLWDQFTETDAGLPGVSDGTTVWGDYDNDGDLDILLAGYTGTEMITRVYRNDSGEFSDILAGLIGVSRSSAAWGDYDNDGDLDILLTGYTGSVVISKIYCNNSGLFTDINAGLTDNSNGSVSWGDYDNDGDLDILMIGLTDSGGISKIYCNNSGLFTDINADLTGFYGKAAGWGDYDNDGDLDVLLSGKASTGTGISPKLYRNDSGKFTDINAGLIEANSSKTAWGDYDNDGDLDILMTGYTGSVAISKIYCNNSGIFIDINAGLLGVSSGDLDWGDYDSDGDLDILMAGYTGIEKVTKIYRNDAGIFIAINAGLLGVSDDVDCGDYDNDGDLDILIIGNTGSGRITKIYSNNIPTQNSPPASPANLISVVSGYEVTLSWDKATDYETPQEGLSYNLYLGTESRQDDLKTSMSNISTGYRKLVDLGNAQQNTSYTLYKDLPTGVYYWSVQAIDHGFVGSEFATERSFIFSNPLSPVAVTASDITKTGFKANWEKVENADGYFIDVAKDESFTNYVSGYNNLDVGDTLSCVVENLSAFTDYFYRVRAYKINSSTSLNSNIISLKTLWDKFSDIAAGLPDVYCSSAAWGDYDNDGDLDILMTGIIGETEAISRIYRNDSGTFTHIIELQGVCLGSVAWGDYDNDGDLDVILTGYTTGSEVVSLIYRNDAGSFTDINAGLPGAFFSSIDWGDYDNDGDLDILLAGESALGNISSIYRNDSGSFTDINAGLPGVCYGSVAWGDYDNDGDLDILLTGEAISGIISRIYRNDYGSFTDINAGLPGVCYGSVAWGDYDNDGDLDILLSGVVTGSNYISKLYRNDSGSFSDLNSGLLDVYNSSLAWGDYDNDGDFDILLSGSRGLLSILMIYRNDSGIFTGTTGLIGIDMGSVDWGDYDNDNDLDILLTGRFSSSEGISRIYRNNTLVSNSIPRSPSNLTTSFNDSTITFSWDKATDNETPQNGLSYNFYLGTESLQGDLNTSMSDNSTGYRKVVQLGNAQQNTSYTLNKALPNGKYYWSVQAIDHAFAGSDFAPEKSFVILSSPQNVHIKHKDDLLKLTWDEVPGAQMYYVYASDDPENGFVNVSKQGTFNGVSWTQTISSVKKFYYVVAVIK